MDINITGVVTPPSRSTNTVFPKEMISKINTAIEWYNQTISVKSLQHARVSAKFPLDNFIYRKGYRPSEWYSEHNTTHILTPLLGGIGNEFHTFSGSTVRIEWLYNRSVTPRFTSSLNNRVSITGRPPIYTIQYVANNPGVDNLRMTWTGSRGRDETISTTVRVTNGNITVSNNSIKFLGGTPINNTFEITAGNTGEIAFEGLPDGYTYNLSGNRVTISNSRNSGSDRNGTFKLFAVSHGNRSNPTTINYKDINNIVTNSDGVNLGTNSSKTIMITNYDSSLNYTVEVPDKQLFTASINRDTITVNSKSDDDSGLEPSSSATKNLIIKASIR